MVNKEKILGINVSVTSYDSLKNNIINDIKFNNKSFIVAINPEKILKAKKDSNLKKLLNSATYQIPDGVGVVLASKIKKGKIQSRVTGIDTMEMICKLSNDNGYKVFMYGAKEKTVLKAKEVLEIRYPKIKIVGFVDGYEKNDEKIITAINKSGADIIFVALGSPKQEEWIENHMEKLNVKIFQGVGGSFDVISGNIKRAPKWMQKCGLEWLYRLIKEPKRIIRQIKLLKFLFIVFFDKKEEV